jgi:hypothetical protein
VNRELKAVRASGLRLGGAGDLSGGHIAFTLNLYATGECAANYVRAPQWLSTLGGFIGAGNTIKHMYFEQMLPVELIRDGDSCRLYCR